jgi:hypothetical protein
MLVRILHCHSQLPHLFDKTHGKSAYIKVYRPDLYLQYFTRNYALPQSEMRPVFVVVANILSEPAFQVAFVNCDDPRACRMLCDIEVQDATTIVTDDKKAIEHTERDRWHGEEVHRGNRFPVITEKGKPARGRLRISRCPFHSTRDRSLKDIKTEHEKLAVDAWRSPRWVLNDHPENQFPKFLRCLSSPDGRPDSGDQLPVQTESAPVPTHHGFRRDRNEGLLPCGPKSTNGDPEELVEQI